MTVPLAVIGASHRDAATALRARLAAIDATVDSPSRALLGGGHITGVVRVETCSRTEWVLSSDKPEWAAELLKSALLTQLGSDALQVRLHSKVGLAGAHYLLRVGAGLDAVAEGETAVGRQLLRAFERSHAEGTADRVLRLCWKHLEVLVHHRRVEAAPPVGVQSLVLDELERREVPHSAKVAVFGLGDMGRAMMRALTGAGRTPVGFGRATMTEFARGAKAFDVVVVASGAPNAWLALPARKHLPLCLDLGSPPQVASAEGWVQLNLDDLLHRQRHSLPESEREHLELLVRTGAERLVQTLAAPPPAEALGAIEDERRAFLHDTLPGLLSSVSPAEARRLKKTFAAFTHALMRRTRGESP